jgi:hypothetical protein
MGGYLYLSMAIVVQAAEDYRRAYKRKENVHHIEKFLLSDYGNMLSFGMGKKILEDLEQECSSGCKRKPKSHLRYQMMGTRKKKYKRSM